MKQGHSVPASVIWLVATLALLWGASWPFMKLVLTEMEPLRFRSFSAAVGSVGLFAIAWAIGARIAVPRGMWPRLLAMSFFNMAAWSALMIYGLAMVEAGRAVILAYTFPV
jgi:drug/metabolite transporter (DMT)-like permease